MAGSAETSGPVLPISVPSGVLGNAVDEDISPFSKAQAHARGFGLEANSGDSMSSGKQKTRIPTAPSTHTPAEYDEPSSPQADALFRAKRGNSPVGIAATQNSSPQEAPLNIREAPRADVEEQRPSSYALLSGDEPSSPQADQLLRIRRGRSPGREDEDSVPLAAGGEACSQSTLDALSKKAPAEEARWLDEPSSPQAQRMVNAKRSANAHQNQFEEGTSLAAGQQAPEGLMQDRLDMLSQSSVRAPVDVNFYGEEPSSPQADRMVQAKRQSQSNSPERDDPVDHSAGHNLPSGRASSNTAAGNPEEFASPVDEEGELCSPQASQMRRVKQMRHHGFQIDNPAGGADEYTSPIDDDGELCSPQASQMRRVKQMRQHGADPFQPGVEALGGVDGTLPSLPGGAISQAELDAISAPAPEDTATRTPSPKTGSSAASASSNDGLSGAGRNLPMQPGTTANQRPLTQRELDALRSELAGGRPATHNTRTAEGGLHQRELDDLACLLPAQDDDAYEPSSPQAAQLRRQRVARQQPQHQAAQAPSTAVGYSGEEPSSPQADQIRRAKRMQQTQSGARQGDSPVAMSETPGAVVDGMAQHELDALCNSSLPTNGVEEPDNEPSSPQSNHMLRMKRSQMQGRDHLQNMTADQDEASGPLSSWPSHGSMEEVQDGESSPQARQMLRRRRSRGGGAHDDSTSPHHHSAEDPQDASDAYLPAPGSPFSQALQQRRSEFRSSNPPWLPNSAASASDALHAAGQAGQSWDARETEQLRRQAAGFSQAELDALTSRGPSHFESVPQHSIGVNSRGDVSLPALPVLHGAGLTQEELNALSHAETSPRYEGDGFEPDSPQAARMQRTKKASGYRAA